MVTEEKYQFVFADYMATGEGRTISLLITRAYPHHEDYDESIPSGFIDGKFVMPVLKEGITPQVIAAREFVEKFGGYMAMGAEFLSRYEFLNRCGHHLPVHVVNFLTDSEDNAGNFNYYSQYHINFS